VNQSGDIYVYYFRSDTTPSDVRYIRDVMFQIRQQPSNLNLIYPPYVTMTYDYVTKEELGQGRFVEVRDMCI
jgi:hypothetical protein